MSFTFYERQFYDKLYERCDEEIKNIDQNNLNEPIFRQNLLNTAKVCRQKLSKYLNANNYEKVNNNHTNERIINENKLIARNKGESDISLNKVRAEQNISNNGTKSEFDAQVLQCVESVDHYYDVKLINSIKQYNCKYSNECNYTTQSIHLISTHIYLNHITSKQIKSPKSKDKEVAKNAIQLKEDQKNALRFSRKDPKNLNTICSKHKINRYRKKILDKGKCIHVCNYENRGLASKYTANVDSYS
jgi:hypothetical protein